MTFGAAAEETVAVDLGGTSVRAALVGADGALIDQVREPRRDGFEPAQIVDLMTRVARAGQPRSAIVGVPGRVDRVEGRVLRARNLPATSLDDLSAAYLSKHAGLPVEIAGDAELAAVGEAYFGAGSIVGATAYLTFSTGVGAACVVDGIVLSGRIAGCQIGFVRVFGPDRPIADVLASGQRMRALSNTVGRPLDYREAQELSESHGPFALDARAALDDIHGAAVAIAILSCHICSADIVVVGGGLARATDGFLVAEIDRRIRDEDYSGVSWSVAVREAARGDDAGLVGAAAWPLARPSLGNAAAPSRGAAS